MQAVIENNIIPPLVHLLATAEFDIRKESAWAISNATSGGSHEQIKYLVRAGCIKPLCDLLDCSDVRIITVALEGLENILKVCWLAQSGHGHSSEAFKLCKTNLTDWRRLMQCGTAVRVNR